MKLSVLERMVLLYILPKEGDVTTIKQVRVLRENLSFTDEERDKLNFRPNPEAGNVTWADGVVQDKEYEFKPYAMNMIIEALKRLNTEKKLTTDHLSLYEKFVGD